MQSRIYLSPLVLTLTISSSLPLQAAQLVPLQKTSFNQLQKDFYLMLSTERHATRIPGNSLRFISQRTDINHITHIRLQQEYAGFPVFGGFAIIHRLDNTLLQRTHPVRMSGAVYNGLNTELGDPTPMFQAKAVMALKQFKAKFTSKHILEEDVTPMIYVNENNQAFWAYKVSLLVQPENAIPERPTAIIDAKTFIPFEQWNDMKTARAKVKGQGFGGNTKMGVHQYGVGMPYLSLSRDRTTGICYMKNEDVNVIDMGNTYAPQTQSMSFSCTENENNIYWTGSQQDGYDYRNGAYSPSNDALYVGSVIKQMYSSWYGVPVLMHSNKPMPLVMRVHYGQGYENAFWDGKQMTFGDGASMMYPLVSLTVGAHEISHGFTEQHSDLCYVGQSGGMNEAFSDMAAQASEAYAYGKSSWSIAGEIMKEGSGYSVLRYMDKPSRDGASIDRADQYRRGMDVHYSSGVFNRLFYLLANKPGWNVQQAFNVMVKANMDYWTPYSTFEQGGCGVISSALDLGLSVDAVKEVLDDVVIDYQNCV